VRWIRIPKILVGVLLSCVWGLCPLVLQKAIYFNQRMKGLLILSLRAVNILVGGLLHVDWGGAPCPLIIGYLCFLISVGFLSSS